MHGSTAQEINQRLLCNAQWGGGGGGGGYWQEKKTRKC